MVRKRYIKELEELKTDFIQTLRKSRDFFIIAKNAMEERNTESAKKLDEANLFFKEWESQIEHKCFQLIALQCPVGPDLRLIFSIVKSTTDIKRIVNTSNRMAKITRRYGEQFSPYMEEKMQLVIEINAVLLKMFDQIIDLTQEITSRTTETVNVSDFQNILTSYDDEVDNLFKSIVKDVILRLMGDIDSKTKAHQIVDLILLARHLERIGDHLCNLGERVVYIGTGKTIEIH